MLKVEDFPTLLRDPNNAAIINTDAKAKEAAIRQRSLSNRVSHLEDSLEKINSKIDMLLEKLK